MKRTRRITVLFIVICMVLSVSPAFAADTDIVNLHFDGLEDFTMAYEVLELVNSERAAYGLQPLSMDRDLLSTAMLRAEETAVYFDHIRPDGSDCITAFPDRCKYSHCGENIAIGQNSAEVVMTTWMNSPGHRSNILTADFKSIGVGCFSQSGIIHWVQVFSSDAASAPSSVPSNRNVSVSVPTVVGYCNLVVDLEMTEAEEYYQAYLVQVNPGFMNSYLFLNNNNITYKTGENSITSITEGGLLSLPSQIGFAPIEAYIEGTLVFKDILYYTDHEVIPGDVNGDFDINNTDLILTARYVVRIPVNIDLMAADMNYDNRITNADIILLAKFIVGIVEDF